MHPVCLEWEAPPAGRWNGPARTHRLRRRLLEIWLPQLRARGVRFEGIELDSALRLWLLVPPSENALRLGLCLQGRARRLLARDAGAPQYWPGSPRLHRLRTDPQKAGGGSPAPAGPEAGNGPGRDLPFRVSGPGGIP